MSFKSFSTVIVVLIIALAAAFILPNMTSNYNEEKTNVTLVQELNKTYNIGDMETVVITIERSGYFPYANFTLTDTKINETISQNIIPGYNRKLEFQRGNWNVTHIEIINDTYVEARYNYPTKFSWRDANKYYILIPIIVMLGFIYILVTNIL